MASASENQAEDDEYTKQIAGKYREISDEKLKCSKAQDQAAFPHIHCQLIRLLLSSGQACFRKEHQPRCVSTLSPKKITYVTRILLFQPASH